MSATRETVTRPPVWAYGWWVLVSALLCFGFLAMLTIGLPFVLLGLALGATGLVLGATRSLALTAFPAGFAVPLFYIAWLNRDGPGTICSSTATSTQCEEQWDPWPWAIVGCGLIVLSVVLALAGRLLTPSRRG